MLVGILYPCIYEMLQIKQIGFYDYFTDIGNYIDMTYIVGSIAMIVIHITRTPYIFESKLLMAIIVSLAIRRTF